MLDEADPYRAPRAIEATTDERPSRHRFGTILKAWFVLLILAGLLNRFAAIVLLFVGGIAMSGAGYIGLMLAGIATIIAQVAVSYFCFRLTVRVNLDYGSDRLYKPHVSKIKTDSTFLDSLE